MKRYWNQASSSNLATSVGVSLWIVATCCLASACRHEPIEDAVMPTPDCSSSPISFQRTIIPLLNQHCNNCHSSAIHLRGIILDDYQDVRSFALEGSLAGTVMQDGNYAPMPYNAPKLDSCVIAEIYNWVHEGAKDN